MQLQLIRPLFLAAALYAGAAHADLPTLPTYMLVAQDGQKTHRREMKTPAMTPSQLAGATAACPTLLEALPALVDPLWDAGFLLDDSSRAGGLIATFTGWRAQPAGLSYLALTLWWGLAFALALRTRPGGRR